MQNVAITFRSLGSAFDDDSGGRAISHPLSSLLAEGCPCGADLSSAFGAPLLQGAALLACKNAICERNQYSPKNENTASLTFPFAPLRKPTSAPSGHLLPAEGGRSRNAGIASYIFAAKPPPSFLIPNSSLEQSFHSGSRDSTPQGPALPLAPHGIMKRNL